MRLCWIGAHKWTLIEFYFACHYECEHCGKLRLP